jgi:hypothetical protein
VSNRYAGQWSAPCMKPAPHQLQWGELFAPTADALLPVSSQPPRRLEVPQSKIEMSIGRGDTCAQPTSAAFPPACVYSVEESATQWYAPYFFGTLLSSSSQ